MSSWGERGYSDVWLNEKNDYVYRHLLKATERMHSLADRFPDARGHSPEGAESGCAGNTLVTTQRLGLYH